jgi:RHS repeat-associated protein
LLFSSLCPLCLCGFSSHEYDPNCVCSGRRTRIIDAEGKATSFTYDQNGNQLTAIDANGHTTSFEYDLNNRQTKIRYYDATEQTTTYDALERTTARTDQDGKTTQYEYDKLGRLVKVKDALNQITQYNYNEVGEQITQTDALNRTTRYEHDKLGRRTKRILPLGQSESYGYDLAGNLISRIDFRGKTTTFTYNNVNRLLSKIPDASFGQSPITFTYTAIGRRAMMTDGSGTTNYSYNNRGWLLSKQTPQGTLTYTHNAVGNIPTVRSSNLNGISVDYSYDALNRLKTVTDNRLGTTQNVTNYSYDNVGNLASVQLPNGVQSAYTYNSLNRLTNLTVSKGTTNLASYAYTLGRAGNRLSVAELSGRTVSYSYDAIYRLTNETIAGVVSPSQNGSIGYIYDAVGNRLSRTSTLAAIPSQQNIAYDGNDRLTTDGYDDNGNTVSSDGKVFSYDFENRLISVTGNGINITNIYNGDGDRVAKIVNGVRTDYLVDTNNHTGYAQVVEEIQADNVVRQYTYGHDLISQRQQIDGNWVTSFYGNDGHGSVRFLTDSTGTITDSYEYDAFGNIVGQIGNTPNNYLYAGEQFDPDLGLYYNRARYLNTGTGRFWTQDSFEGNSSDPLSLHKYLYSGNDPINKLDPSGNVTIVGALVTAGIIALSAAFFYIGLIGSATNAQAPTLDATSDYISTAQLDYITTQAGFISLIGGISLSATAKYANLSSRSTIGLPRRLGQSPFNPSQGRFNCVSCTAAYIRTRLTKIFHTADDIEGSVRPIKYGDIDTPQKALNYITQAVNDLDAVLVEKPLHLKEPGDYVLIYGGNGRDGHALAATVIQSRGKTITVVYDPQTGNNRVDLQSLYQRYGPGKSYKVIRSTDQK